MRNYSRAWDCLLVVMILLNVLAWIWFPMMMAIWTASSFIATGIYVVVRLELDRNARKRRLREQRDGRAMVSVSSHYLHGGRQTRRIPKEMLDISAMSKDCTLLWSSHDLPFSGGGTARCT